MWYTWPAVLDMVHVAGSVRRDLRCVTKNFMAIYNVNFFTRLP
jgi:hypothetical protein